ncbi:hypothetical protein [Bosea vaviloviae]|uniref:Swt1-like HEPN domain-containing protein n=1 Tax=Bosea vaviloviae TaxID=1526658 RepID=A0A1D7U4U6_9HYPH|nr:hypothetical protein [Bosea vaviloviae]AOO82394.1 hypothetical protein BHK69_19855 [Bosea vaviloviae]
MIHHQLSAAFGSAYISAGPLPQRLKQPIVEKMNQLSERVAREVDATTFDQAIDIVCHPERWPSHFALAMANAYPLGHAEARFFLEQIKAIRNDLSHGRSISTRQLEKGTCYANDLADAIKEFFRGVGMAQDYNVPMIVRYVDSLGNQSHLSGVSTNISNRIIDWRRSGRGDLYPGDTLIAEVEVDPSYEASGYAVSWFLYGHSARISGTKAVVPIEIQHVSEQIEVRFEVKSDRQWHRQGELDDALCLLFRVLPPVAPR